MTSLFLFIFCITLFLVYVFYFPLLCYIIMDTTWYMSLSSLSILVRFIRVEIQLENSIGVISSARFFMLDMFSPFFHFLGRFLFYIIKLAPSVKVR